MTDVEKVDVILEAMTREGLILNLQNDEYKMTELGMIKASEVIAKDYRIQMELEGLEPLDLQSEKLVLEEFTKEIALSRSGVLGYLVRYYKRLNA